MKKKRTVVLDKNYLQSAPYKEIRALCARGASMPDVLFYELISNEENRDKRHSTRCHAVEDLV